MLFLLFIQSVNGATHIYSVSTHWHIRVLYVILDPDVNLIALANMSKTKQMCLCVCLSMYKS